MMYIKELDTETWNSLLPTAPCVYTDPRWLLTIQQTYPELKVKRLACFNDNSPLWLLPIVVQQPLATKTPYWSSVAFGNYGGIIPLNKISTPDWLSSLNTLQDYFLHSNASALEIRGGDYPLPFLSHSYAKRFILSLRTIDSLWSSSLNTNARNMVRRAEKAQVSVTINEQNALSTFNQLYEAHAHSLGTPVHARQWYSNLINQYHQQAFIVIAYHQLKPIGATMVLHTNATGYLHAACTLSDAKLLSANDLLYWESIKECTRRGLAFLDFGRTRPIAGQLLFKRKWGAQELPLPYFYLTKSGTIPDLMLPEKTSFSIATTIWKLLPRALVNIVGPHLRVRITT